MPPTTEPPPAPRLTPESLEERIKSLEVLVSRLDTLSRDRFMDHEERVQDLERGRDVPSRSIS